MPVLILALLGAASQPLPTSYDVRHFSDCFSASLYAADHPTVGRYVYKVAARTSNARIARVASGFQGQAQVALVLTGSQLQLPRWSWPHRNAAQRVAYDAFVSELEVHELGHRSIAQAALQGRSFTLTVLAPSRSSAERALRTALATQLHDVYSELLRKQELYDRVTEHGKRQSDGPLYGFPGGENVVFSCP